MLETNEVGIEITRAGIALRERLVVDLLSCRAEVLQRRLRGLLHRRGHGVPERRFGHWEQEQRRECWGWRSGQPSWTGYIWCSICQGRAGRRQKHPRDAGTAAHGEGGGVKPQPSALQKSVSVCMSTGASEPSRHRAILHHGSFGRRALVGVLRARCCSPQLHALLRRARREPVCL